MSNEPTSDLNAEGEQKPGTPDTMTRAEVTALLKEQIENNGAYKSMQTALNRANQRSAEQIAAKDTELGALKASYADLESGFNFIGETLLNALPEADRSKVEAALKERKVEKLEREVKQMREAPRQTQQQAPPQDNLDEQMKLILAEAQEALEDAVVSHGIDPKAKGLDYGTETETFAARLKKLNASVKAVAKAKEDGEVEGVRQKVAAVPTRTSGSSAPAIAGGKDLLELGTEELWNKMRAIASGNRK